MLPALAENAEDYRYTVFFPNDSIDPYIPKDPRFRRESPRWRIPMLHRRGTGTLGKIFLRGFDLIHFPCNDIWYSDRGKAVVNVHDLAPLHFPERFFKNKREEARYRFHLEMVVAHATMIITQSRHSREDLLKNLRIEPERVRAIHPCNDPVFLKETQPLSPDEAKQMGIDGPYFLFVGRMDFRKNLPLIFKSFSLYRQRGGRVNLVLVGEQDPSNPVYYPPIQPLLDSSGERSYILWLRGIPDEGLPRIYAGARGLVNLSMFEGFGSPLIEAMACGTPVIAARSSSFPEIAGDAAVLVEPNEEEVAEAMKKIDGEESLREGLIQRGKKRANDFLPVKHGREVLEVYRAAFLRR